MPFYDHIRTRENVSDLFIHLFVHEHVPTYLQWTCRAVSVSMHFHVWNCLFKNVSARDMTENQLPEVAQCLRVSERLIPSCLYLGLLMEPRCTKELHITFRLALTNMTGCIREVPEMLYNLNDLGLWPFHGQLNFYWWQGWLHDYIGCKHCWATLGSLGDNSHRHEVSHLITFNTGFFCRLPIICPFSKQWEEPSYVLRLCLDSSY